eukprot:SM000117S25503  [mRNA]  locus=s117:209069:212156:+ [translate_table: standard]
MLAQRRAGRSAKSKLTLAKFGREAFDEGWELREGKYLRPDDEQQLDLRYDGGMDAQLEFADNGNGIFSGYVFTRSGYVELARRIVLPDRVTLDRYEGLLLSVCGDGRPYLLILETQDEGPPVDDDDGGHEQPEGAAIPALAAAAATSGQTRTYFARFNTRLGYSRIRVPFSIFRPLSPDDPPLQPGHIHGLAIRFEPRRQKSSTMPKLGGGNGAAADREGPRDNNSFKLQLDFIKALPGGEETDFILVSCAGAGVAEDVREKVVKSKLAGETALRNSGIGYTIIRPGVLQEEPGGQRALIFDQGNRITQGISCADVADVCVKALHDPTARNKSFDVCYEYTAEASQSLYELVAHLPDKSNNYLTPALALLEKNT